MNKRLILVIAVIMVGGLGVQSVRAQTYVEPTTPLGGQTAWPLNSSANTQYKSGSLIIGSTSTPSWLCLNSDAVVTDNPNLCIQSWDQLRGNFVSLSQKNLSSIPYPTLDQHVITDTKIHDVGYSRIIADNTKNQVYTIIAEANGSASQSATAVYASDSNVISNNAATFNGRVFIGYANGVDTQLCLNSADYPINASGKGCIKSWSDLSSLVPAAGNYVALQPYQGTTKTQAGQFSVSGTGALATGNSLTTSSGIGTGVIVGAPQSSVNPNYTCGDGACNGGENATTCKLDCDLSAPGNIIITGLSVVPNGTTYKLVVNYQLPAGADPGDYTSYRGVRVLRRNDTWPTDPAASPSGYWYATAGTYIYTSTTSGTTGLNPALTYYYRLYSFDYYQTATNPSPVYSTQHNFSPGVSIKVSPNGSGGLNAVECKIENNFCL